MSYSDYGGLCWRKEPKEKKFKRYLEAEDASLMTFGPKAERPIERATGFKFDALLKAAKAAGKEYGEENNYLTEHAHHLVIGGMKGISFVSHKGHVIIALNGKEIKSLEFPDKDGDPSRFTGQESDGTKWVVEFFTDPHYVSFVMWKTPDGYIFLGVSGYGVGDHCWKDDKGNNEEGLHYPTIEEYEKKLLKWKTKVCP